MSIGIFFFRGFIVEKKEYGSLSDRAIGRFQERAYRYLTERKGGNNRGTNVKGGG